MTRIFLSIFLAGIFFCATCSAKTKFTNKIIINMIDSNGKRQGYWIEYKQGLRFEMYYRNDTLNGIYKTFYQNQSLSSFGIYLNGLEIGSWYYFDEKGILLMEQSNIKHERHSVKVDQETVIYENSSYIKFYQSNGKIKEEGNAFFNEVEEHILKFGFWKIYDGNSVRKEKYNMNGELVH